MKKLILLFLFLPLLSLGQNQTIKETKFAVGLCFSTEYFNTVYYTNLEGFVDRENDTNSYSSFGFSAGISVLYKLNDKFTIESGLSYYQTGWESFKLTYIPIDISDPVLYPDPLYKYKYISVPLKLNYFFLNKKIKLFASVGLIADFLLEVNDNSNVKYGSFLKEYGKVSKENYNTLNLQIVAGFGADYDLNKHFKLRIEPYFRRSVNSVSNTQIKNFMYSAGANMGVYYKF